MRRSLCIYVMALGVGAAAFPADLRAAFDDVNPVAVGTALPVNLGRWTSKTRAGAERGQSAYRGVAYPLSDRFALGLGLNAEHLDITGTFDTSGSDSGSVTGVGYAALVINPHLNVDASVGYTRIVRLGSKSTAAPGVPFSRSIDGFQIFGAANLHGVYRSDRWGVSGDIGYVRAHDNIGGLRESIGTLVPGGGSELVRVRVGGRFAYNLPSVLPIVSAYFVWDKDLSRVVVGFRDSVPPEGIDYVVGGGLNFRFSERISGGVGATTTVGRADFANTTVRGIIRFVF